MTRLVLLTIAGTVLPFLPISIAPALLILSLR